uniref:Ig-like domain-containing protein n=1 Tax=Vombatus ursinus TaxID=29139 RepID=A0A4X2LZY6_VOMUR
MLLSSLLWATVASVFLGKKVTQLPSSMTGQEGEDVTLSCKYDTSDSSYALFWYKQLPSGEMIFLIRQDSYNQQNASEDRYLVNFQKINGAITFTILSSQLQDVAMYFCVFSMGTVRRVIGGTIQKDQLTPCHCPLLHTPQEETCKPRQEGAGTGAPQLGGADSKAIVL